MSLLPMDIAPPRTVTSSSGNSSLAISEARVDGGARLIHGHYGDFFRQLHSTQKGHGLPACRPIPYSDDIDAELVTDLKDLGLCLLSISLGLVGVDGLVMK